MLESHRLIDLEERVQRAGCASQAGKDRVAGGAPPLDCDVVVDCEGGVLYCL